jgi:hypothetical protein
MFHKGEVWFARFPLEEDKSQFTKRPVIVLDETYSGVLCVKITKHAPRSKDPYDISIINWRCAGLRVPSTARISKAAILLPDKLEFKIGSLDQRDYGLINHVYKRYLIEGEKQAESDYDRDDL